MSGTLSRRKMILVVCGFLFWGYRLSDLGLVLINPANRESTVIDYQFGNSSSCLRTYFAYLVCVRAKSGCQHVPGHCFEIFRTVQFTYYVSVVYWPKMFIASLNITSLTTNLTKRLLSTSCSLRSRNPLELSYNVYDKVKSDPNTSPVLILHGLFGSKSNWNSLSKAFHQKTHPTRKVMFDYCSLLVIIL